MLHFIHKTQSAPFTTGGVCTYGANAVRGLDLTLVVLQQVRTRPVEHTRRARRQRRGVPSRFDACRTKPRANDAVHKYF